MTFSRDLFINCVAEAPQPCRAYHDKCADVHVKKWMPLIIFNSGRIDWIEDARQEYVLLHYPLIVIKIVKDHNHKEGEDCNNKLMSAVKCLVILLQCSFIGVMVLE